MSVWEIPKIFRIDLSFRNFGRYRLHYKLVSRFPRFKHCTLTFNMLKDRLPTILKYFDIQECDNVPLTDKCSKYFWLTEPTMYHDFGTVKGINYNHDEKEITVSNTDSEDESGLMTIPEFQRSSHWYHFKQADFPQQICPICRDGFEENAIELSPSISYSLYM